MDDFDKLKKALQKGRIVVLYKGRNGGIKFGGSFENEVNIIGTKYSPSHSGKNKLPEHVFIKKIPDTWIL